MQTISKTASSINDAIESKRMDRDKRRNFLPTGDKYTVKLRDEKGKEYEVKYFF